MEVTIKRISEKDDLAAVAASIKAKEWGADNELSDYKEDALREVVSNSNNIQLIAYHDKQPVGLLLAVKIPSPDGDHWLYMDQIDVRPDFRRQGVGRNLLKELFNYAKEWGLSEVWLASKPGNLPAQTLYKSLQPTESEPLIGHTYKIQ